MGHIWTRRQSAGILDLLAGLSRFNSTHPRPRNRNLFPRGWHDIRSHIVNMATPSLIPTDADRDHPVRIHRVTRTNRHLWYQLTVLQQPERARACGAGTKGINDHF